MVLRPLQCARENLGELVLIATGPLTNVALAVKLEPRLPQLVQRLYVMGGNEGRGNVTPSEWPWLLPFAPDASNRPVCPPRSLTAVPCPARRRCRMELLFW